jgi:4a-hydroxytetrahydrobiopterin dehydratase
VGILGLVPLLSRQEIDDALQSSAWRSQGSSIVREWELEDFAAAMRLVNRVAELAEEQGHHPDILVHGWNKVRLELSTHSEGGLTQADLDLAARIDALG